MAAQPKGRVISKTYAVNDLSGACNWLYDPIRRTNEGFRNVYPGPNGRRDGRLIVCLKPYVLYVVENL